MRGIGDGRGEHIRNHRPASRGGPATLIAFGLAACSSQDVPPMEEQSTPDAAIAYELPCPEGVITWRDALLYLDALRCTAMASCFPDKFATWYGDQANCMAVLGALHCKGGVPANWCDFAYPRDRCAQLLMCRDDAEAIACDPDADVPASCEAALQ